MRITDPTKARAVVAECFAAGVTISDLPKDMDDSDWVELANGLYGWLMDIAAENKVSYIFSKKK